MARFPGSRIVGVSGARNHIVYCKSKLSDSRIMAKSPTLSVAKGKRSSLSFGTVQVYEFPIVVGDNPEVSKGCPVTIDWEPKTTTKLEVNKYEYLRARRRPVPRKKDDLKLSEEERAQILLEAGFSSDDIANGTSKADAIKKRRAETNKQKRWDNFHEAFELTGRRVKKIVSTPRGKKNDTSLSKDADSKVARRWWQSHFSFPATFSSYFFLRYKPTTATVCSVADGCQTSSEHITSNATSSDTANSNLVALVCYEIRLSYACTC